MCTMQSIHLEVLTNLKANMSNHHEVSQPTTCKPSITMYSRILKAKMSIHHEVSQPTTCNPPITMYSRIFRLWRYSDVGYWWIQNCPPRSSTTRSDRGPHKTKREKKWASAGGSTSRRLPSLHVYMPPPSVLPFFEGGVAQSEAVDFFECGVTDAAAAAAAEDMHKSEIKENTNTISAP